MNSKTLFEPRQFHGHYFGTIEGEFGKKAFFVKMHAQQKTIKATKIVYDFFFYSAIHLKYFSTIQ